ncbi:hypothetical protein ABPG77_010633 [Micractinium sp. CCAP 211/92]
MHFQPDEEASFCIAFRDLLASNPQLLSVVEFDQYADADHQQQQPHQQQQRTGILAALSEWQPWEEEQPKPEPVRTQLPAFLRWLGANASRVSTLCSRLICLQHLRSLRLEVRSLLHVGIWVSPLRCLRHLSIVAGSLAVSRHLGALPSLALLELQCSPQEGWDHDLHFGRLEMESEEGPCLPPSLERLCLRRLEAWALPPGLAACTALRELQLDHVLLDGEAQERWAALAALTAVSALRLDCVPAAVVPAELGSITGLQRLSLRHAAGWLPGSVEPPDTSLAHSAGHLALTALTSLTFVGFDEVPAALELVLGMPPARGAQLARLAGLRRLSFLYDNARAHSFLSEDAVRACSQLSAVHLDCAPTQPGVSFPLLSLLVRRLQLGAPRLRQLSTPCPGAVEAGLCRILELEAAGGTGYEANELEPAGPWMRQLLQRAGGAAGARAAEAAWLRGVWGPEAGPPEWLDPWRLPAWSDE